MQSEVLNKEEIFGEGSAFAPKEKNAMFEKWKNKRYLLLALGAFMMLCIGVSYAWSVFNAPISKEFSSWSQSMLQMTFTIFMISYSVFGILGGLLVRRLGTVKINLGISAVLILTSFIISSQARNLAALYIGFGLLGGAGVVFAYNAILVNVTKWFSDKVGVATGVLLMGYGMGSFVIGNLYSFVISLGLDWRNVFIVIGIIVAAVTALGLIFMSPPPSEYCAPAPRPKIDKRPITPLQCTPTQMMKRPSFWILFGMGTFTTMAGMGIVSNGRNLILAVNAAATPGSIALVVGLISIASACGRIFTGFINDFGGLRFNIVVSAFGVFAATLLVTLAVGLQSYGFLIATFILSGFCAGMSVPDGALVTKKFFGEKNYQVNLQVIMSCGVLHAFSAAMVGGLYDVSGGYIIPLLVLGGMALIGAVCSLLLKKP